MKPKRKSELSKPKRKSAKPELSKPKRKPKPKYAKPRRPVRTPEDDDDDQLEFEILSEPSVKRERPMLKTKSASANNDDDPNDVNGWKKKSNSGFRAFNISQALLKGIWKRGFKIPTPIQRKAIPPILDGNDVVAMARTGSGKTAAFLIPLFEKLQGMKSNSAIGADARIKYPRALILSPTRELATQTLTFFKELGKFLKLKVISILGGDSMESQFAALHDKPDVIIATPGRFMHLCVEMEFKLDGVEYVVFDEADRLFEMGFGEQLSEILHRLPENRQTVLFSATMPKLLVDFTKAGLRNPILIRLDVDTKLPERLKLNYYACRSEAKLATLLYLLNNEIDSRDQTIVFVATKHHVEYLHALLDRMNISNCIIYSSLDPAARKSSLECFRNGKASVMIVTDIAARGIDIPVLDNVINFHFPAKPKLFMHRVGRVARAGRTGTAYSIVSPDETAFLFDLHLFLGRPITFTGLEAGASKDPNTCIVGRVPQELIDQEAAVLKNVELISSELTDLAKVCKNGYAQYIKSRPNASPDSNKRAKQVEMAKIPMHPSFGNAFKDGMTDLIVQMQNYRPKATIFEIGPKTGSEVQSIMKEKRIRDQKLVEKHRTLHSSTNSVAIKREAEDDAEGLPRAKTVKDENFIHYLPANHHSETGLSVLSSFEKQLQDSVLDLTGDDSGVLKTQHSMKKWDRKKKKFVTPGADNKKSKRIKTESGAWISASYKSDRYKQWMQKSKVEQQQERAEEDGDDDDGPALDNKLLPRRWQKSKGKGKVAPPGAGADDNGKKGKGRRFKSELKRPEEILKNRKIKEKNLQKNKPGKKKKKNRNKSR